MKKTLCFLILATLATVATALAAPSAFVTIAPQKYFVDRISGGLIPASIMILPGANPHAYEPKPKQMTELATASIYFTIGDTFDTVWMDRIKGTNPGITVVRTEDGVEKIPMEGGHHHEHDGEHHPQGQAEYHEHDGEKHHEGHAAHQEHDAEHHGGHDHDGLDPHIWLDPALVRIQARNIRDGLCAIDPQHADQYRTNAEAFLRELDALDAEIRAILAPIPKERRTFLVFHPSWGYFARAYDLRQASIEVEGKEASPRELAGIIELGRKTGTKVIFVQPQFSEKSAAVIAKQIGARVVRLDPLAPDWADNLRQAAKAMADALQ